MNRWLSQSWLRPDETRGEVRAGLHRMTEDLGLDHFHGILLQAAEASSHGVPPDGLSSYPREWTLQYEEKGYHRDDPLQHLARRSTHPFFWEQVPLLRTLPGRQRRVLREMGNHGILAGLRQQVPGRRPGQSHGSPLRGGSTGTWTGRFDEGNAEHRRIKADLEYGGGIPDIPRQREIDADLRRAGFELAEARF